MLPTPYPAAAFVACFGPITTPAQGRPDLPAIPAQIVEGTPPATMASPRQRNKAAATILRAVLARASEPQTAAAGEIARCRPPRRVASSVPVDAPARARSAETAVRVSLMALGAPEAPTAHAVPAAPAASVTPTTPATPAALREQLIRQFGAAQVASRLAHDVFPDDAALQRQLAHENKAGITPADYAAILPHIVMNNGDAASRLAAMRAAGELGIPHGWQVDDRLTLGAAGMTTLRSRLVGPNGESGMVARSYDGTTLHLDKAYKSTLPTRLEGIPGSSTALPTIQYLTARACRILGVSTENLQQIKVNRLQHRPTLAHLDWLLRKYPDRSLPAMAGHTTWARSYIRETADPFALAVQGEPVIDLQGKPAWCAAHPGAVLRSWNYMGMETERLTIKHFIGQSLPKTDDPLQDWRAAAQQAIATHQATCCAGLDEAAADAQGQLTKAVLMKKIDALHREERALHHRYGLGVDASPLHLNFDLTFQLAPKSSAA